MVSRQAGSLREAIENSSYKARANIFKKWQERVKDFYSFSLRFCNGGVFGFSYKLL